MRIKEQETCLNLHDHDDASVCLLERQMVLFALSVTYLAKDDPSIFSLNRTERGHEAYNPASYMMMIMKYNF